MRGQNLSLLLDLYELTMAECYLSYKKETLATFDLFVRALPKNRAYLVAAGLGDALEYIKGLKFGREELRYLKAQKTFSARFLKYLSGFKFTGDIWAMPEGTIFFPGEPVMRVTAPMIEAQIIESFLLNTLNLQTMIATKALRVVTAASGKGFYDFSLRRTHGTDAAVKVARASYIAGFSGTSNVLAGKIYNIPVVGTMAHSFIMSFKHEIDSFLAYASVFPEKTILLVDTYDTKKGIANAVTTGLYLKEKGHRLLGIRLDSGDIVSLSKFAREKLDWAGLKYVKIFASGNLDEFKIRELVLKGAAIDSFGVGTHMGTSQDAPSLDVIYKISEITGDNGDFLPTMKLSQGKHTYPGRKQVFRIRDSKGRFLRDILGLKDEKIKGKPLLVRVVNKGRIVYNLPSLKEIRSYLKDNFARLAQDLKEVYPRQRYTVAISPKLKELITSLRRQLEKRQ